ncbi:hypothetical protein SAMD00019534_027850 [Acytostelium subglobosum LB1]|uniref:hypothetical protein n=1 Tax=Acytostelium subglobosum LB1 TaxID=1410327 RepID=UPI000644E2B2|nr:hypothetical protein SAMD00019534_027850 [Acytostelium subglobosum LB1]GAM19610.1 hypothetical protein SAMD00019534_027850 [Acytostelium subglobosum LB1]|eukprot:XP_012756372.1 hypothetical protein SAMD00019534_027850 [Acytostelium subglobosum LB1]
MVLALMSFGWFVMWKMYLSKYEFVRELLGYKKEFKPKPKGKRTAPVKLSFDDDTGIKQQ